MALAHYHSEEKVEKLVRNLKVMQHCVLNQHEHGF